MSLRTPEGLPEEEAREPPVPAAAPALMRPHWREGEMNVPDIEVLIGCREAVRAGWREVPSTPESSVGTTWGAGRGLCTWCPLSPPSVSSQC